MLSLYHLLSRIVHSPPGRNSHGPPAPTRSRRRPTTATKPSTPLVVIGNSSRTTSRTTTADVAAGDARPAITLFRRGVREATNLGDERLSVDPVQEVRADAREKIHDRHVDTLGTHQRHLYEIVRERARSVRPNYTNDTSDVSPIQKISVRVGISCSHSSDTIYFEWTDRGVGLGTSRVDPTCYQSDSLLL